jgi:ABC-type lipoprotein export system ATPase subunit
MPILSVTGISKQYGGQPILANADFALTPGRSLALTGDSGGGKTTLLSITGLLQDADAGEIVLDGRRVEKANRQEKAVLRARYYGLIFQRARLVSFLTAIENVLAASYFAHASPGAPEEAEELLRRFGLYEKRNYRPRELSLGQLRRVALARALFRHPPILLADEPTNDLDPANARVVVDALFAACQEGGALLLVTHDHALAALCHDWLKLENGRLCPARS